MRQPWRPGRPWAPRCDATVDTGDQNLPQLRAQATRALRRTRLLDEPLKARWLELVPHMNPAQLTEMVSALESAAESLLALDARRDA